MGKPNIIKVFNAFDKASDRLREDKLPPPSDLKRRKAAIEEARLNLKMDLQKLGIADNFDWTDNGQKIKFRLKIKLPSNYKPLKNKGASILPRKKPG